jgi:hypothetical protein
MPAGDQLAPQKSYIDHVGDGSIARFCGIFPMSARPPIAPKMDKARHGLRGTKLCANC